MTQVEIAQRFEELYDKMASSKNVKYMEVFGETMKKMMEWFVVNYPDLAQEHLDRLCSIMWNNYLTDKETQAIISNMEPKPAWTKEQWKNVMDSLGIATEEKPYYNCNALFVAVSMIYSDSAKTIAKLLGKPLDEVTTEEMAKATHLLAIDKLKDEDSVFNIRHYFGV
jgi:phage-related tail protein